MKKIKKNYDCKLAQVSCCTINNGANMVKCVNLREVAQDEETEIEINDERDEDLAIELENSM